MHNEWYLTSSTNELWITVKEIADIDDIHAVETITTDHLDTRVVGGHEANLGQFPFQVAIMVHEFGIWCGGILYSRDTLLTAAHCYYERRVVRIPDDLFAYVFGKNDLTELEGESEQLSSAMSVTLHEEYSPDTGYNDIAVVKLVDSLCLSKYVQPLRIGERGTVHSG